MAAGIAMSKSRWDKSCRAASTRRQRNCAEACSRAVCRRASWIRFGKRSADGFLLPPNERSSRNAHYLCSAAGPFRSTLCQMDRNSQDHLVNVHHCRTVAATNCLILEPRASAAKAGALLRQSSSWPLPFQTLADARNSARV